MRRLRVLVAAATVALLAACGLQPASQFIPEVKPGEKLAGLESLDGATITVTSKDFTEQLILGKILSLTMAAMGADVVDNTNTKGSTNARESVLRGDADLQWEYTGTGWVVYLGHAEGDENMAGQPVQLNDADAVYQAVLEQDLADNNVYWTKPATFNNTYAMAVTAADAEKYGLESLSDIAKLPPEKQTFCLESEFSNRGDGWPGMQEAYGLAVPSDNIATMDAGIIYGEVGNSCVFGEVFDTDGRIVGNNLVTLKDDKTYFPIYEPSVNIRQEINEKYPQIAQAFELVSDALNDTDLMRELNARVDVAGENPVTVAQDWMTQSGFLAAE